MESQQFCLKWDGYQGSVTSVFDHLRQDSELVDVTLCCDGRHIQAHRMMLSACSPYFRELFKGLPFQQLAVFLKDTSAADLSAIIEFMYKGSVNVSQTQLASFIKTAEMLQVRGLSGEEEKPAPPSSRRPAAASPVPRRPREPSLPPPPPPPPPQQPTPPAVAASPPQKRRRTSGPVSSPDVSFSASSPGVGVGGSGGGTPAVSPRPASLPSPVPVVAGAGAGAAGARRQPPSPRKTPQQAQEGQQQQSYHQEEERQHQETLPLHHHQQGQQVQGQSQQQHRQQRQERYTQGHQHVRQQGVHQSQQHDLQSSLGNDMVKVEKLELTDDEVTLEDTLDHVAELERFDVGDETIGGQSQLQLQHHHQQQQQRMMNLAAAAVAAQSQLGGSVPGPSQRLAEDGTAQGSGARFACTICGQCYSNPDSRQMHMKKHSGETTCPVCGKIYSMVHNLRRHMRTAHGTQREPGRQMLGATAPPQGHILP